MADPITLTILGIAAASSAAGAGVGIANALKSNRTPDLPKQGSIVIPPPEDTIDTDAIARERARRLRRQTTLEDLRLSGPAGASLTDAGIRIPRE